MLIEATSYFAKLGRGDEVLEMRRRGTGLRVTLGLRPGRILIKIGDGGPTCVGMSICLAG